MKLKCGCDMSQGKKVNDPVCKMDVKAGQMPFNYLGIEYSFCSQQCHDRFASNPQLYIGKPGKPSAKQDGVHIIKRRVLRLDDIVPDEVAKKIDSELRKMMGIKEVTIDKNIVRITYDLLEATTAQIEARITATGEKLTAGWADKIKRAFIHYLEESELDILEQQPSSHNHRY